MLSIEEEKNIIQGCCKGDRKSQKKLYEFFAKKMLVVALRYTDAQQEAEDVLQESFIKIFANIKTFRNEGSIEHWIKKIVINTALKSNRGKMYLYPAVDVDYLDLKNFLIQEQDVISSMYYEELVKIIQQLPISYRTIFNLYAIEGYQHKEIAEMLTISEGTSKSQYARARIFLQRILKKYMNDYKGGNSIISMNKTI